MKPLVHAYNFVKKNYLPVILSDTFNMTINSYTLKPILAGWDVGRSKITHKEIVFRRCSSK